MSPLKRRLYKDYGESAHEIPPKRLRGGGDDYPDMDGGYVEALPEDEDQLLDNVVDDNMIPEEVLKEANQRVSVNEKDRTRWTRPDVSAKWLTPSINLDIQWLDMDMTISQDVLPKNPNPTKERIVGQQTGPVPVLRTYGVNEDGHSVAVYIHGYTPYGYFALPPGYTVDGDMQEIRKTLEVRLKSVVPNASVTSARVVGVELVRDHTSIYGYDSPDTQFLKIYVSLPGFIPKLKSIMEAGISLPGISGPRDDTAIAPSFNAFECNVPFVLRYMVDRGLAGAGWLTLPKETYLVRPQNRKETHCQVRSRCGFVCSLYHDCFLTFCSFGFKIEVDISYDDVIAQKSEGEWNKIAPLRILSFDIECQGRKGHFPEAKQDPVIQIANCLTVYGNDKPIVQNVFTLKGCLPIVGAQVISSDKEEDMLMKWRAFLEAADPDIITGTSCRTVCTRFSNEH